MHQYGHWTCNFPIDTSLYFGFIYIIINKITNQKYIGRRNFNVKGTSKKSWHNYKSSSSFLKKDIKIFGIENFTFSIIEVCDSIETLCRREIELQIENDVLYRMLPNGIKEYYNRNIHGLEFNGTGTTRSVKTRKKQSDKAVGSKLYHDIDTGENIWIKLDDILTANLKPGMSSTGKQNMSNAKVDCKIYHHPKTKDIIWIKPGENIPDGYIIGRNPEFSINQRGEKGPRADKNVYQFLNKITGETFNGTQIEFRKFTGISNCQCSALIRRRIMSTSSWKLIST